MAVAGALALALAGCSAPPSAAPQSLSSSAPAVYEPVEVGTANLSADEFYASYTESDWAREADYVAVVRVDSERALPVAAPETGHDDGDLIMRSVTVSVQKVVWKHPDTKLTLPESLAFNAMGWSQRDGKKYRIGFSGQPYLLVGGVYLMALRYFDYSCPGKDDPADPAPEKVWGPLGSYAVVPFESALGTGEFEGRAVERAGAGDGLSSFRSAMIGKDPAWVADRLTAARQADPTLTHQPGPMASCFRKW